MIKSRKITQSAKGERCTANIVGVCNYDIEKTVFAHFPDGSGGSNKLNGDLCGGYVCSDCHDALDGRQKSYLTPGDKEFYMRRSTQRTLIRLVDKELVKIVQ